MPRVLGPYRERHHTHGERWRVVLVHDDGSRSVRSGRTEADALAKVAADLAPAAPPEAPPKPGTVAALVEAFIAWKVKRNDWVARSVARGRLDLGEWAYPPDLPLRDLTPRMMLAYLHRTERLSLASRRSRWATVRECCRWPVRKGYLDRDPTEAVDPDDLPWMGRSRAAKIGRSKAQLDGAGEARRYLDAALELPYASDRVAALLPLLTGLSSGEVRHMRARDVDLEGGWLWVRPWGDWKPKTKHRTRSVTLPGVLRGDLAFLVAHREPDGLLWPCVTANKPRGDNKLRDLVHEVCSLAGLAPVPPHGLRGTYGTILRAEGYSSPEIGRALGHGSDGGRTADRHYARGAEVQQSLDLGGPTLEPTPQTVPKAPGRRGHLRLVT